VNIFEEKKGSGTFTISTRVLGKCVIFFMLHKLWAKKEKEKKRWKSKQLYILGFHGDHHLLYLIGTAACQWMKIMVFFRENRTVCFHQHMKGNFWNGLTPPPKCTNISLAETRIYSSYFVSIIVARTYDFRAKFNRYYTFHDVCTKQHNEIVYY
jgi:hypothetical protein